MVEIEHIQDIEKDQPAKSSAKEQKLKDPVDANTETQDTEVSEATEHDKQIENQEDNTPENNILVNSNTNVHDLKPGNRFYGSIKYNNPKGKQQAQQGIFLILTSEVKGKKGQSREYTMTNCTRQEYKVCSGAIKIANIADLKKKKKIEKKALEQFGSKTEIKELLNKLEEEFKKKEEEEKEKEELKKIQFSFSSLEPEDKLKSLIKAGMNNIWMVGPAGCGKSTIARNTAKELDIPYLCISCGIGTSATEFTGYKYPTREATKFAEFYAKKSIILIDEMTALDPSVAQVINAALANGEIETTTGTVLRHPECIIIATSNTFGNGGDDMNFDRYIEGLPCLKKRIPTHGIGTGKFVKLHISICKNCWCSAQALMVRAYTAMRIIDMLESQGYRVQISAYADNEDPGYFNEEPIGFLGVEVIIKKFEDPLIKGQILTAISPWFFRYWMFKFWNAKFKMNWGYGHSVRPMKKETTSDIYIQTGEALTDEDAESTIERISKLFNKEEQFQLLGGSVTILYGTINLRILDNLWKREPAQQK